jgi:hypothetical protein
MMTWQSETLLSAVFLASFTYAAFRVTYIVKAVLSHRRERRALSRYRVKNAELHRKLSNLHQTHKETAR